MEKAENLRYEDAMAELEQIQQALENHQVPVDELSAKVRRARALLAHCRNMLYSSQKEIDEILKEEENKK